MHRLLPLVLTLILCLYSCEVSDGLSPAAGELGVIQVRIVNASVSGTVIIDGIKIDKTTPDTFKVFPGKHRVTLFVPGYEVSPEYIDVAIQSGDFKEMEFSVQETASGNVILETIPQGAQVYLDSNLMGLTPLQLNGITTGSHYIKFKKTGYREVSHQVIVNQNEVLQISDRLIHRKVFLIEDFSNTGCPPCPGADERIRKVEKDLDTIDIAVISYHPNFPSPADPFYQLAPEDIQLRISHYGVNSTPSVFLNGEKILFFTYDELESQLKGKILQTVNDTSSSIALDVRSQFPDPVTVKGDVSIKNQGTQLFKGFVYAAVIQKEIHFEQSPGTNGQKDFYHIFSGFLENLTEESIELNPDEEVRFSFEFTPEESLYGNWQIIIFVQDSQGIISGVSRIE